MNTEDMGVCHLKKGVCNKNVKNDCNCILCHQGCSSSFLILLFLLLRDQAGGRDVNGGILYHGLWLGHAFWWGAPQEPWDHAQLKQDERKNCINPV